MKVNYENTEYYLDMFLKSPKKVQQLLMIPLVKERIFPFFWEMDIIKSPIEQIFITAFGLYCKEQKYCDIYLFPQHEVTYDNKKYIIDFAFLAEDYLTKLVFSNELKNTNFKLAIECDGYEFHFP